MDVARIGRRLTPLLAADPAVLKAVDQVAGQLDPTTAARVAARDPDAIARVYNSLGRTPNSGRLPSYLDPVDQYAAGPGPGTRTRTGRVGADDPASGVEDVGWDPVSAGSPDAQLDDLFSSPPPRTPDSAPELDAFIERLRQSQTAERQGVRDARRAGYLDRMRQSQAQDGPAARAEAARQAGGQMFDDAINPQRGRPSVANNMPRGRDYLAAGGLGAGLGIGGSIYLANQPRPSSPPVSAEEPSSKPLAPNITSGPKPMSTADLAAETSPPPVVKGYRDQALDMQKELNERRRKAGGEIPEAQQMRREIQRLFDLADGETNAGLRAGPPPAAGPTDYRGQARKILADLNSGAIPQQQRAQAQRQMQALYAQADAQDNARTTAYPRSAR
jgi:hypothetical protein